ncbi:hypothetical protein HX792_28415 [Pseudomonas sp. B6002]|uniref:hypothetical protein n=1 Tax=Pseudomonas sp. B6002 TaxID=2726978 RepID=UPI0015A3D8E0|nr:hypothetical protein [Pseudomonas sp. B6002]NVZ54283.1 hypothetical protein [Pseudomonas sp. B6002]
MTDSKVRQQKKTVAQKARPNKRKKSSPVEPAAPSPGVVGPLPEDSLPLLWDEAAHKIPLSVRGQPFKVTIPSVWTPNNAATNVRTNIEYFWKGDHVWTEEILGPYDPAVLFPYTKALPAWLLDTPGVSQMYYKISGVLLPTGESERTLIDVDDLAPNQDNPGAELIFGPDTLDGVSDAELTADAGIPCEVPRYLVMRTEDVVMVFFGTIPNIDYVGSFTVERRHIEDGDPLLYLIPEAVVRTSGGGERWASYRLMDRVGNIGPFSDPVKLDINLVSLPDLLRPLVPRAETDGLIDLDDIRQGVSVSLQEVIGAEEGDTLTLRWNTHILATITVGATQIWPISVDVTWPIFLVGGFDARYPVRVWYAFARGSLTKNSPDTFIEVDATVAGDPPVSPDPINPALPIVTVKGVTADNVVTPADSPGPVLVEVPLFFNPQVGENLRLFWGNDATFADIKVVDPGDVAGQTVQLYVPWALIVAGGGLVEVYYWTYNGVNYQRSRATQVRVELDTLTGLAAASLLNNHPSKMIACDTVPQPYEAVILGIPWSTTHFEVGDRVRLFWSSHRTTNGGGAPIAGSQVWFELELTDAHRTAGVAEVYIEPFDPLITVPGLIPTNGSGLFYYRLYKMSGPTGKSAANFARIDLIRPGGTTCLAPPAGKPSKPGKAKTQ